MDINLTGAPTGSDYLAIDAYLISALITTNRIRIQGLSGTYGENIIVGIYCGNNPFLDVLGNTVNHVYSGTPTAEIYGIYHDWATVSPYALTVEFTIDANKVYGNYRTHVAQRDVAMGVATVRGRISNNWASGTPARCHYFEVAPFMDGSNNRHLHAWSGAGVVRGVVSGATYAGNVIAYKKITRGDGSGYPVAPVLTVMRMSFRWIFADALTLGALAHVPITAQNPSSNTQGGGLDIRDVLIVDNGPSTLATATFTAQAGNYGVNVVYNGTGNLVVQTSANVSLEIGL
jgi:hypothetical protein